MSVACREDNGKVSTGAKSNPHGGASDPVQRFHGEQRQVTVIYTDPGVDRFPALLEGELERAEAARIAVRCLDLFTAAVRRFEGAIARDSRGGMIALFGAFTAADDSPQQAVHAALAVVKSLSRYSHDVEWDHGLPLDVRVGVNTGAIAVGRMGEDLRMDYTDVGGTADLAVAMYRCAPPNSVLVSEATQRGITEFFQTSGPLSAVTARPSPVRAFVVFRTPRRPGWAAAGPASAAAAAEPAASDAPELVPAKILTARSALEGERRQVTVLCTEFGLHAYFTMLNFSPAFPRDSWPEALVQFSLHCDEIKRHCKDVFAAEVRRFGGTIAAGHGLNYWVAFFGAPLAHEDSPRRAVHAALGMQRTLREYSNQLQALHGFPLDLRVGLNTGPIVAGRIGDDLRIDYIDIAGTVNRAVQMYGTGRYAGGVIVSEATHRAIVRFFETRKLGKVRVHSRPRPRWTSWLLPRVRAFEVLQLLIHLSRFLPRPWVRAFEVLGPRGQP